MEDDARCDRISEVHRYVNIFCSRDDLDFYFQVELHSRRGE